MKIRKTNLFYFSSNSLTTMKSCGNHNNIIDTFLIFEKK
jgi:hypothetical protein